MVAFGQQNLGVGGYFGPVSGPSAKFWGLQPNFGGADKQRFPKDPFPCQDENEGSKALAVEMKKKSSLITFCQQDLDDQTKRYIFNFR